VGFGRLLLFVFVAAASIPACAAVLVHDDASPQGGKVVEIVDTIGYPDFAPVAAVLNASAAKSDGPCAINVWLDSPGGDIDAAMKIGRLIHEARSCVRVGRFSRNARNSVCASACVLILAAGTNRSADASVGIHCPYSLLGVDTERAQARYLAALERIRTYLEEMGMPTRLYEEMMRVSAASVHWLTRDEKQQLGLTRQNLAAVSTFH
jgi:hypothetical protein